MPVTIYSVCHWFASSQDVIAYDLNPLWQTRWMNNNSFIPVTGNACVAKTRNSFILSAIDLQLRNINEPLCCTGWHVFLIMMNMGICLFESIPHTVWNPPVHQMCICLHLKNGPHEKHYLLLLSKFTVPSCFGKLLALFLKKKKIKLCICEPFFKICSFIRNKWAVSHKWRERGGLMCYWFWCLHGIRWQ